MNLLLPTIGFGIVTASILALAAVGLTLQFSVTGVVNFAFGDLMTLAAYTAWLVNTGLHWNVWIGAIVVSSQKAGARKTGSARRSSRW